MESKGTPRTVRLRMWTHLDTDSEHSVVSSQAAHFKTQSHESTSPLILPVLSIANEIMFMSHIAALF
jgi:hypothetical protein